MTPNATQHLSSAGPPAGLSTTAPGLIVAADGDAQSVVDKVIRLLSAFGTDTRSGMGVSELARRTGLPKSTASRVLSRLHANGAVERAGRTYRLGEAIRGLAQSSTTAGHHHIRDSLTPHVTDLYEATRLTVHLAVLDDTEVVYLHKLYGHLHAHSPARIGERAPAYCTAVGKVLLAHDARATQAVLSGVLVPHTPATITDPAVLLAELDAARRDGVAYDRQEISPGLSCMAGRVLGPTGRPVAALSLSGAPGRLRPGEHLPVLRRVCREASNSLRRTVTRP